MKKINNKKESSSTYNKDYLVQPEIFRSLYENSTIGLYRTTPDGQIILANPALIKMLGFNSIEELRNRNLEVDGFEPNYSRKYFKDEIEKKGEIIGLEAAWLKKDGSKIYVRESARAFKNEKNEVMYYDGTVEDITEKKLAELAFEKSEKSFRKFFNEDLTGDYVTDPEGKILLCNKSFANILGFNSVEEVLNRNALEFYFEKNDRQEFLNTLKKNGKLLSYEIQLKRIDGKKINIIENVIGDFNEKGELTQIIGYMFDITELKKAEESLRNNEEKLRTIVEGTPYLFFYTQDKNGDLTYVSPTVKNITGYDVNEFLKRKDWFVTDSPINTIAKQKTYAHLRGELTEGSILVEIKHANGSIITLEVFENPVLQNGNVVGLQGVAHDITNKLAIEKSLKESEQKYKFVTENIADVVWILDLNSMKFDFMSPSVLKLRGYSAEEVMNQSIDQVITPESFEKIKELLPNSIKEYLSGNTNQFYTTEINQPHKNGNIISTEVQTTIFGSPETGLKILGVTRDITERKRSEKQLRDSEEKYRKVFENVQDVFFITDKDGILTDISPSIERHTEYPREELLGQKVYHHYKKYSEVLRFLKEIKAKGEITDFETEMITKTGKVVIVSMNAHYRYDNQRNIIGIEGYLRDITEQKTTEKLLHDQTNLMTKILEMLPVGLWIIDKDGKIIHGNPAGQKIWGGAKYVDINDYGVYKGWRLDTNEQIKPEEWAGAKAIIEKKTTLNEEIEIECFDGSHKIIRNSAIPIIHSDGHVEAAIVLNEDITERKISQDIIKDNEKRFKAFMDHLPGLAYMKNQDGKIIFANKGFDSYLNLDSSDMIGKTNLDLFPSEFAEKISEDDLKALNSDSFLEVEETFLDKTWTTYKFPITQSNKKKIIGGLTFDITERKRMEMALAESEQKYRQLFEANPQPMWVYDMNTLQFLAVNEAAIEHYGYSRDEFLGMTIKDIRPVEDIPKLIASINYYEGIDHAGIWRHTKKDGTIIFVEIISHNITFEGKSADLVLSMDVTEKIKAQEEILKLSRAVQQSPAAIVITDTNGLIDYANPKYEELTGYTLQEIRGKKTNILKSGHTSEEEYKNLWDTICSGKDWKGEFLNKKKNGELFWASALISPVKNGNNKIKYFLGILENITERKNMIKELIDAKERAEQSDKLKSEFLAQVSHEIRTPLFALLSFSNLLKEELEEKEELTDLQLQCVNGMSFAGKRIIRTIDLILNVSEIQTGLYETSYRFLRLYDDIIKHSEFEFRGLAKNKNIELSVDNSISDEKVYCDEYSVSQIFTNLIDNAIKYTDKGYVKISMKTNEDSQVVTVIEDSGIGMDENFIKNELYKPFSQEEKGYTRKYEGNGLGLALVKKYCELNNIQIDVKSEKGKGTSFTLTFLNKFSLQ